MATYRITPEERKAMARARISGRVTASTYKRAYEIKKQYEEELARQVAAEKAEKENKESMNWFVRGLSTIGDIAANVITGAVKGLEGIYDLGAGIVGAVGGIFSDDFQDDVQKHIAYDWTSETIGDPMQEWFKYSYTKDGGIIEGVASGIGQMLPAVAITIATGGAGAGSMVSTVGQIASLAYTGVSAAGNATESAYQDGANYYGGLGYGVASGAVEVATEKLFGGATKNVFGKGMLDDVGKSIADTGIKRVAKNALEEGIEEIAAEAVNPALKAIYKGKSAFSEYTTPEFRSNVLKAGAIGSLASLAYSGTVGYGLAKRGKGYVGSEADINDSLHEIEGQKKKANNLFADDRLSDENAARITQNLQGNYQNIEKTLKKATPEKRANLIKKFSLESAFEADGTMKADFASTLDFTKQAEAITENGVNGSKNAVASLDRRYINPDLIGQDSKVNNTLSVATEGLRQAYMKEHNATHEQAVEAVKDITAFKGELSDKGKASYSKFKKGLNYLNGVSGHTVNMVVVDEHDSFNGNISDDTIYIGADTFENDSWAGVLVHEYTHFAEGTKEYAKLIHYLRENQELSAKAIKDVFGKGYGFTVEGIEKLYDKFEKGEKLTESELQTLTVYESELGAHLTENLLGNESFIDRLVGKETKLAEKVLNKIADLKKMFERIGNAEARAEYKRIKKAEKLYLGAVEKAGYAYINRKIVASRRREEIDASKEIEYNRKKTPYVQWKSDALAWANSSRTKIGDMDSGSDSRYIYFYEAIDPDNDGRATDYRVVAKVSFANKKLINEWYSEVKANNERNHASVYESIDEYERAREKYQGDNGTLMGQPSRNGRIDEVHQGKSEGDGKRNTQKGDGSSQGVKYSLKESVEKDVLAYYGSTYRWAETGYIFKDGTRLDLSGRRDGASGGRRTVDHRDIFDIYEDIDGGEAMIEFMSRGNIRVSPENPGINLQVEPTAEQYRLIQDMVERLGWKEEYFSVDFDDSNGDTVESLTYEGKVSARKVVADIKYYFKEGKLPYQSELSQFRYSLKDKEYMQAVNEGDVKTAQRLVDEVAKKAGYTIKAYHGTLAKDFTEFKKSFIGSRFSFDEKGFFFIDRKSIADDYAHSEFDSKKKGRVLETYLKVKKPLYVDSQYALREGLGKVFRDDDAIGVWDNYNAFLLEEAETKNVDGIIIDDGMSKMIVVFDPNQIKSSEAITYDDKGRVIPLSERFNPSNNDIRFSLKDSNGNSLTEEQAKFFADSKIRDEQGNLRVMYHGTAKNFNTFLRSKMGKNGLNLGEGFYFTPNKDQAEGYAEGKSPRIMEVYLNVKNPLSRENSLSKNEEAMAWIYKTIGEYHSTEFIDGMTEGLVGSIELIKEYTEKTGEGVDEILKRFGYDGIDAVNTFVVFDSNQVKYTTNQKPSQRSDMRYSLKNSEGETLTAEQAEYFAKSKIRDSKGNLLVVYHGSPKAGFTVFRTELEGAYFTADKNYALDYARANNENIYSVYLNIEKPFDTRDPKAKKIFEEQFFGKWGNGAPLTDRGLLDWTDGADMYDFIQENGLDYDGIIIDEGGVPTANGVRDRGISYVAFYPEQIKNTSNKTPTADKDIRFSLKRNQIRAIEARGVKGDSLLNAIDLAEEILAVNGEITDDGKAIVYHATSLENAHKIIESGKMFGKEDNLFFSTKSDGEILGYGDSIVEAQIPLEKLQLNDVFAEEVHLTMSVKPNTLTNIRFSLKDKYFYRLTDGQVKKALANYTKFKVYSKVDAESIINNVLGNYMSFGESYGVISGKTKNEVIEMLWRGLNTAEPGRQAKVALDIAEYILQNAVLENIYEDDSNQVYIDTIQVLKPYLHSINLNGIKGDIKHKYDRDNSPYLLWGKRKEHGGKGADVIAMELEEQGFYIDGINEADIFFQIDTAYREAVAALKKQAKELLDSSLSKEERYELKQQIAKEVLRGFDYQGKPSKLADIAKTYSDKAKFWKDKYYDERKRNTVINRLLDSVQKIKDIKLGTFLNATQFKNEIFKGSIEKLSSIKYRGDLNKSGTRKIVAGLQEWYSKNNPMLEGVFDEEIASILEDIATGEGDLSTTELRALTNVVDYFKHFIETYNKVYRNGKYVDAQPIVEKYIGILQANKSVKVGWLPRVFDKVFNNANGSYLQTFADPMTVARYMDMYDDGFYTEMLTALREGATKAQIDEMTMREPIEEFLKKHKKYMQGIEKRKVKYLGQEIPAREALALYMTLGREQALAGLAESGFEYLDGKESVRIKGFAVGEELTLEELKQRASELQETLASQFTEADNEYIEIARRLFNEVCREKKKETDLLRRGYSNIAEGEYVPIRRANISHSVDTSTLEFELNRVSNASFNKDTVKGAKNELFIEALDRVLDRHIRAIAQYANLSLAIDEYNTLYNLDVGGNPNNVISVRTEGKNSWTKGDEYFRKLISDIQGIPATKGEGLRAVSFIRGSYAKYQLGANPKVWLTQLSSFGAAGSMLDVGSIIKGMAIKTSDVDEYCALAKLRNNDNTAAMAQGVLDRTTKTGVVLDKVNKTGDLLMKPIGMVDRFVIKKLFGACQVQVEKNNGLKVGTEENKVKAGELLEKVILETQQNSMATERSAAMRSGSELMRTITMFSADSMKVIGRVVDSVGELSVLKAKRKATTDPDEIEKLDKKIKSAKKKVAKSTAALATSAVFMALIAQLFRWLYNKDDEDENIVQNMTVDAVGNLLGGLPLIRDVYSRFAEGYDISDYTYSALNDLLDSGYNIFAMVGDVFSGETDSQEAAKNIKNLFYASGQILGLPTRNVYNMAYGLTKRFSPETAYKIDSCFYDQNYSSDLAKAIENEDDEMIATIVGIMLDEKIGGIDDSSVRNELDDLIKKGFSVLPRSVGDSITYEGEKITLTSGQAKSFKEVYSVANEALASLVGLSQYESATDEVKAKAINFIWDIYYNLAIEEVLGVDIESKAVLFAEAIDIEKLAIIIATARAIEADTDKNGKSISGTRKAKIQKYVASLKLTAVQKYMVMGYLGYSNKNGESQVKAYINRLNLSKSEKEKLLAYSGYEG